jgi:hypothetical protein
LRDFRPLLLFTVKETTMVGNRSEWQWETWEEYTITWARKPRTQQERIAEQLSSSDLDEVLTAMEALEKIGPEASDFLQSIVQHDARKYREGRKQLRSGAILIVLVALAILSWNVIYPGIAGVGAGCLLLAVWLATPCALSWYGNYRTYRRRLSNVVALLHRAPLPNASAEMLEALSNGDSRTVSLATRSLTQLLPQLTNSEAAVLQAHYQISLRRALRGYDSNLILAILEASEEILNPAAIPEVRRLTHCPDWIAASEQIQAAARRSLTALEADARRLQTVQTLLRASSPPKTPSAELLRQATGVPTSQVHQMLRAFEASHSGGLEENDEKNLRNVGCHLSEQMISSVT